MDARIALPAAVGAAMVLGIAMSALVPTHMVTAGPPPWSGTAASHQFHEQDATFRFTESRPQDLDPSMHVGPQYEPGDGATEHSIAVALKQPAEASDPVYVSVDYGFGARTQEPAPSEVPINEPPASPEITPLPPQMEAAIY